MAERSRVKFNPVTKEMEIEGSESFVKATLDKLQAILSGSPSETVKKTKAVRVRRAKKVSKKPKAVKTAPVKKEPKAAKAPKRKPAKKARHLKKAPKVVTRKKRGTLSKSVLALIKNSAEGVSTAELKEKTGMQERQIWGIIAKAKKTGTIKQVKRGVYGAA